MKVIDGHTYQVKFGRFGGSDLIYDGDFLYNFEDEAEAWECADRMTEFRRSLHAHWDAASGITRATA